MAGAQNTVVKKSTKEPTSRLGVLIHGFISPDMPTRKMTFLFLGCLLMVGFLGWKIFGTLGSRLAPLFEQSQDAKLILERQKKMFEQKKAFENAYVTTLKLGKFTLELEPSAEGHTPDQVEFEIFVKCDSDVPCKKLEKHIPIVMDRLSVGVVTMTTQELLSSEGKSRMKDSMKSILNGYLNGEGQVVDVNFTKMVIGNNPF